MPKISVVMPAYNAEKYISEAIDSILNQTYTDFEFIIINDGSTDKTEEIILSYKDERIIYLKNEKNMGIVYTLNRGLDTAKGEYIARMDSDDISLPTRFEKQLQYIEKHKNIAVLGTAVYIFGEGVTPSIFKNSSDPKKAKAELLFSPPIAHPTVFIRKSTLDTNNLRYDSNYNGLEDAVLWWHIAQFGDICSMNTVLLNYRQHKSQISATRSKEKELKIENFLSLKMSSFGLYLKKTEFELLQKYHIGNLVNIQKSETKMLVNTFKKILNNNKKIKKINQYYLKKTLGSAFLGTISFLKCSNKEILNLLIFAFKTGVLPLDLFIKSALHFLKL